MPKFRPYPRREYRRLFRRWARRNATALVVLSVFVLAFLALETVVFLSLMPDAGLSWWLLGVLQAALVGVALHVVNAAFLAHEREAIWHLRGAWGEDATRDELRRARRKRLIWGWVDSISLAAGDLDHVVVTRGGGLLSIDSKWRSDGRDTDVMARSAARARRRAEGVAQSLLKSERGSHRAKGHAVTVRPLVVIWGPAQHQVPDQFEVDGIPFVGGRRLVAWLRNLGGEPVTKGAAKETLRNLEQYRSTSWQAQSKRKP
ncbi:MAG TPA: hypothetical protein VGE38_17260 [Nocardioides sp.]|uniref:hypothetical protein n=1 Tax=Nocardioides sp. TaxID=35761 RepID=UPI002EDA3293